MTAFASFAIKAIDLIVVTLLFTVLT